MFDNTRKIKFERVTMDMVKALRQAAHNMVEITTRPAGKGILERVSGEVIVTGSLATQMQTVAALRKLPEYQSLVRGF